MSNFRKEKGITIVTLVITIVVLLIISAVTIGALQGDEIVNQTKETMKEYEKMQEQEKLQNVILRASLRGRRKITLTNLTNALNSEFNEDWELLKSTEESYTVKIGSSEIKYEIYADGKIEENQEIEIIAEKSFFTYTDKVTIKGLSEEGKETLSALAGKDVKLVLPEGITNINRLYIDNATILNDLKSLSIHAIDITKISQTAAFSGAQSLISIYAPNLTEINTSSFNGCTNLADVYMPNLINVTASTFQNCTNLTKVDVSGATTIGGNAFASCKSLSNINISSASTIGSKAFYGCTNLTSIDMPNATSIGSSTFEGGCNNLINIDMPNVISIGGRAFLGCTNLKSVSSPNLMTIGGQAFYNCTNLSEIDLSKVTEIADSYAFYACKSLTSVDLTNAVTIGQSAFYQCTNLGNIKFSKLETVKTNAFYYSYTGKVTITYTGTKEEWSSLSNSFASGNTRLVNATVICSDGTINE